MARTDMIRTLEQFWGLTIARRYHFEDMPTGELEHEIAFVKAVGEDRQEETP